MDAQIALFGNFLQINDPLQFFLFNFFNFLFQARPGRPTQSWLLRSGPGIPDRCHGSRGSQGDDRGAPGPTQGKHPCFC